MKKNKIYAILTILICFSVLISTAKADIYGDPTLDFPSPLGDENAKNDDYNRCRLIRMIKPLENNPEKEQLNKHNNFALYSSMLYAQSIKISAYLEQENEKDELDIDIKNEMEFIRDSITPRLLRLARRMNIINSFEASIQVMEAMKSIDEMSPYTYKEISEGVISCEDLQSGSTGGQK